MKEEIAETLRRSLPQATVFVESEDGTHFSAVVVSPEFESMPLVRQHQTVMKALKADFDTERLHALQLRTFTPDAWAALRADPLQIV
jgi:acid stress-induced BolA-like protein IbaG/YrbA